MMVDPKLLRSFIDAIGDGDQSAGLALLDYLEENGVVQPLLTTLREALLAYAEGETDKLHLVRRVCDELTSPIELIDDDWYEAFQYADRPDAEPPGTSVSADGFTRGDVIEVIAKVNGENDDADWVGVFRLRDGRYAYLSAGCDYTGWD